jgi:hypothetical protein
MKNRFKKGDVVICWLEGPSYGDKFTVIEHYMGLNLQCHKSGSWCIVNNPQDYQLYNHIVDTDEMVKTT